MNPRSDISSQEETMGKTTKLKIGGELTKVHLVRSEQELPHTARYWGCGAYGGYCVKVWRCEGKFYALGSDIMACYEDKAELNWMGAC